MGARIQPGLILARPGVAWSGVALALALPAAWIGVVPYASALALHPALGWAHNPPSAWVSAAWAHASLAHWHANLAGCALLALVGVAARLPALAALAWALAWPLTHGLMLLDPRLHAYMGASGVLHAGAAVAGLTLARQGRRGLGGLLLLALVLKCAHDAAQGMPTSPRPGLDILVAPLSHLAGTLSGLFFAGILGAGKPANG